MTSWSSLLTWRNCFWLMVPLLIWNLIYAPKITDPRITSDAGSPGWLLILENAARITVFMLPLFLPLQFKDSLSKVGWVGYILGTLIYFASWLPLLFAP